MPESVELRGGEAEIIDSESESNRLENEFLREKVGLGIASAGDERSVRIRDGCGGGGAGAR